MAQLRTQGSVQSQWNALEKELIAAGHEAAMVTLEQRAKEILSEYRDYTSYETDTGNMDASVMGAIFRKNQFLKEIAYTSNVASEYKVHSNVHFENEYGHVYSYSAGETVSGKDETLRAIREYKSDGNIRRYELAFFGDMFYRYALEYKGYIDFFNVLERNYDKEQMKFFELWYKKMRYGKLAKKIIFK